MHASNVNASESFFTEQIAENALCYEKGIFSIKVLIKQQNKDFLRKILHNNFINNVVVSVKKTKTTSKILPACNKNVCFPPITNPENLDLYAKNK